MQFLGFFRAFLFALVVSSVSSSFAEDGSLILSPETEKSIVNIEALLRNKRITFKEPVFSKSDQNALRKMGQRLLPHFYRIQVKAPGDIRVLKDLIRRSKLSLKIESNSIPLQLSQEPLEKYQWALHNTGVPQKIQIDSFTTDFLPATVGEDIHLEGLTTELTPRNKVRVAILDTGIDYDHPNLKPKIVRNTLECNALQSYKDCLKKDSQASCDSKWAAVDADKNGYPLDCSGWNVTAGKNKVSGVYGNWDASDTAGHGTHVAGIIAAAANGTGIRGVSQDIELLPIKVIKTSPNSPIRPQASEPPSPLEKNLHWTVGFADIIARGMLYAIRANSQVVNLSLAWTPGADSVLMRQMVSLARERGIVVVAAAGNDSSDSRVLPCQYDEVICTGSHNPDGTLAYSSSFGSFVDIAAPGIDILSTWPMNKRATGFTALPGYEIKSGTSMATPYVAGVAAALLAQGVPVSEIYARLLIGARPAPSSSPKYFRSGNLDFTSSLRASAQPLILPEKKLPFQISWDRKSKLLPLSFSLKNFWADAKNIHVSAILIEESPLGFAHLENDEWDFAEWSAGSLQKLDSILQIDDLRVDGRLLVQFKIESAGVTIGKFRVPLEISTPITKTSSGSDLKVLPILGGTVPKEAELVTVTALDGKDSRDYIAWVEAGDSKTFQLLQQKPDGYQIAFQGKLDSFQGTLLLIQRIDLNQDRKSHIVFVFQTPPAEGSQVPGMRFVYFNDKMIQERVQDYDNKVAVLSDRFQWIRMKAGNGFTLVPFWMTQGKTPELDKPAPDPWDPTPDDPLQLRLFYLAQEGLHTVAVPEELTLVQILSQSTSQTAQGKISLLLAKGDDYKLDYFTAELSLPKIDPSSKIQPLVLNQYRMFLGLNNINDLTPLDSNGLIEGMAFSGPSAAGSQRTTSFQYPSSSENPFTVSDGIVAPATNLDSVTRISGVYAGTKEKAVFAQTHYQIQYQDMVSGETAFTSLDRFSFLPSLITDKSLYPVVASRGTESERLPAVMIPASLGVTDAVEVVVPIYNPETRKLLGLSHPARFRFKPASDCDSIGNSIEPNSLLPSRLVFFCGDRFIQVPLQF